jgi:anti-sigma-K factor RskA
VSDDTIHDFAAAYALDAVEGQERVLFEAHLPGCQRCQRDVIDFAESVVGFSVGLEQPPPVALRERLLSRIAQEPQDPGEPGRAAAGVTRPSARRSGAPRSHAPRSGAPRSSRWLVGIVAAAVIGVGAVVATELWPEQQPPTATEQVLEAEDSRRFTEQLNGSTVTVVNSASLRRSVLIADDMQAPPEGRAYQLWFIHEDGTAVSAGLMPRDDADRLEVLLDGDPTGAAAVGITLEPAGGSDQPTSDPLVSVPIQG